MAWYWIILIVIGYFIIGGFLGFLYWELDDDPIPVGGAFIIIFWPAATPICLAIGIGALIAKKIIHKNK